MLIKELILLLFGIEEIKEYEHIPVTNKNHTL